MCSLFAPSAELFPYVIAASIAQVDSATAKPQVATFAKVNLHSFLMLLTCHLHFDLSELVPIHDRRLRCKTHFRVCISVNVIYVRIF